ncbi:helix-turn-helix domain-containing protein [Roseomonas terrae]|uniref:Helix-turn-helix domain-containing protein n=1 Tax=Neoroseomonas terrae TaxID=424799 RepID=A0ABS5EK24_9PROT|nr:helix-turn-helix domain-containing protein [Neoroseomonas terrae]
MGDLTAADVYGRLRAACREAGSQQAWAEKHGMSPQYVSDVLNAKRPIPDSILSALGLIRVTVYRAKSGNRRIAA